MLKNPKVLVALALCLLGAAVAGAAYGYVFMAHPPISNAYGTAPEQTRLQLLATLRATHGDGPFAELLERRSAKAYRSGLQKVPVNSAEAVIFEYWHRFAPGVNTLPHPAYADDPKRMRGLLGTLTERTAQGDKMNNGMRPYAAFMILRAHFRKSYLNANSPEAYVFARLWGGPYRDLMGNIELYSKPALQADAATLRHLTGGKATMSELYTLTLAAWKYGLTRAIPGRLTCEAMSLPTYRAVIAKLRTDHEAGLLDKDAPFYASHFADAEFDKARERIFKKCGLNRADFVPPPLDLLAAQ